MIKYILQVENQNLLQVVYSSGYSRYIFPDSWGCYESNMTKTQLDFIHNSYMVEMIDTTGWSKSIYYYLDKENPCPEIISQIEIRNRFYNRG